MGFNLQGGYGAGAGADMLQQILKQKALEFAQAEQIKIDQQRLAIEQQRANSDAELRKMVLEDRSEARADSQKTRDQTGALKIAGQLRPRGLITPDQSEALAAGGMGDKIVAPTLNSRNIGQGMTSTPNPGRGESFEGLPDQLDEQTENESYDRGADMTADPVMRGKLRMLKTMIPDINKRGPAAVEFLREQAKPAPKSAALQEFEDVLANPGLAAYQDKDANRKRPVVNVAAAQNANNGLAMKLADDYSRDAKDHSAVNAAMRRVVASAKDPSAAGDLSLLYNYMKILDPLGAVREQDFAQAAKSGSLPQQIQASAMKVVNGQRLTPEQRGDFVNRAERLYAESKASNTTVRDSYTQRAKKFGVDPSMVFTDIGEPDMGGDVDMVAPDGRPLKVPASDVDRLLKLGAKKAGD